MAWTYGLGIGLQKSVFFYLGGFQGVDGLTLTEEEYKTFQLRTILAGCIWGAYVVWVIGSINIGLRYQPTPILAGVAFSTFIIQAVLMYWLDDACEWAVANKPTLEDSAKSLNSGQDKVT